MLVIHLRGLGVSYQLVQYLHVMVVVPHCQVVPVLYLL